jgi:hypothetical protein
MVTLINIKTRTTSLRRNHYLELLEARSCIREAIIVATGLLLDSLGLVRYYLDLSLKLCHFIAELVLLLLYYIAIRLLDGRRCLEFFSGLLCKKQRS